MKARRLPRAFYARPTLEVLAGIIGKVLVHDTPEGRTAGIIIEAEAYIGESDPACHAAPGLTRRNAPLYGQPGRAYVYLNYGLHSLVNAVTEEKGSPAAILIRALEPLEGIELMRKRRLAAPGSRRSPANLKVCPTPVSVLVVAPASVSVVGQTFRSAEVSSPGVISEGRLCRGPGNLTVAMGIGLDCNMLDLTRRPLWIEDRGITPPSVSYSARIGIRVGLDRKWRACWRGHEAVSGLREPGSKDHAKARRTRREKR